MALATRAWAALQRPASSLERLTIDGEAALPSTFAVTDFAADAIGVAALSVAELIGIAGGSTPAVRVDRRRASLWFGSSIQPLGWTVPDAWDPIAGDYAAADGWIRLHTNAHRDIARPRCACSTAPPSGAAVEAAVARWSADELETAVVDAAAVRRRCAASPPGTSIRRAWPWRRAADLPWSAPAPGSTAALATAATAAGRAAGARPDAGAGRPGRDAVPRGLWRRRAAHRPARVGRAGAGPGRDARQALCAPRLARDRRPAEFEALLADADVLVHGYRPGALEALGFDAASATGPEPRRRVARRVRVERAVARPSRIRQPGADEQRHRGRGHAAVEGADRPVPLPVQALDHATGYLMAAAVVAGATRRLLHGESSTSRLSLARTARALVDAGEPHGRAPWAPRTDDDLASTTESTAWGPARRVRAPVSIDGAPMAWRHAAARLGSAPARWADR